MTRINKIILAAILTLFVFLVIARHFVPESVNWQMSFNGERKIPNACRVTFDMLRSIFPGNDIKVNNSSLYSSFNSDSTTGRNLIIINNSFDPDETDLEAMLEYARRGNSVFISSQSIPKKLSDTLGFKMNKSFVDTSAFRDSKTIMKLFLRKVSGDSIFIFRKRMPEVWIDSYNTASTVPLGCDGSGHINFIAMPFGGGKIFIHCQPFAFTNYQVLYGNWEYASDVLSFLPEANTIWDQYYKPDRENAYTPVRYILSQAALRSAYYLLLLTLIIYMIFGSRRLQRAVPVIEPDTNTSLYYVITVGKLYYRSGNHIDLANKKLTYFKEFVRNRYHLPQFELQETGLQLLSKRSGIKEPIINKIIQLAKNTGSKKQLTADELVSLNDSVEYFYKNCK